MILNAMIRDGTPWREQIPRLNFWLAGIACCHHHRVHLNGNLRSVLMAFAIANGLIVTSTLKTIATPRVNRSMEIDRFFRN